MGKFLQVVARCLKSLGAAFFIFVNIFHSLNAEMLMNEQAPTETAIFAGGSFWCMQHDFDQVDGVISTVAGYTGGKAENPTYEEVLSGSTGHVEAVQIVYDPKIISYKQLLNVFWHNVDPTRNDGQFCDEGTQYRPVIFYEDDQQKSLAEESEQSLIKAKKISPILVDVLPAMTFYPAENYHQEYWKKNSLRYKYYRHNCGRDKRLKEIWGARS